MTNNEDIERWSTQLRKGLAELCVLAAIHRLREVYGYQLIQFLHEHGGLELTESTVYPLLARLAREGNLQVRSAASPSGPPRRYYSLTASGKRLLKGMTDHWKLVSQSIHPILFLDDCPET